MKITNEQIEAALRYINDNETLEDVDLLEKEKTEFPHSAICNRFAIASQILAAAYREQQREIEEMSENISMMETRHGATMLCNQAQVDELRQQRDTLADALDLSANLNCAFFQHNEEFYDVVFTATMKDTGKEMKISAREILEKSINALATLKGEA